MCGMGLRSRAWPLREWRGTRSGRRQPVASRTQRNRWTQSAANYRGGRLRGVSPPTSPLRPAVAGQTLVPSMGFAPLEVRPPSLRPVLGNRLPTEPALRMGELAEARSRDVPPSEGTRLAHRLPHEPEHPKRLELPMACAPRSAPVEVRSSRLAWQAGQRAARGQPVAGILPSWRLLKPPSTVWNRRGLSREHFRHRPTRGSGEVSRSQGW